MIFASKSENTLIVGAADTFSMLEAFYANAVKSKTRLYADEYQPSITDMLLDNRFNGFKKPPYIFSFANSEAIDTFVETYQISIVPAVAVIDKQKDMIHQEQEDPYFATDARLIEEIHGLEENDPWDYRDEEQKQKDEEERKEAEKSKKAGKLSGDSFGPSTKRKKKSKDDSGIRVTDIRTSRNEDGSIEIDDVLAVKGLYDDNGKGAWLPTDAEVAEAEKKAKQDGIAGESSTTQVASDIDADEGIEAPETEPDPETVLYAFTITDLTFDLDVSLDMLGILSSYDPMEKRDKMIVFEDQSTSILNVKEHVAHRLSSYLSITNVSHTVAIVDSKFENARPFTVDESKAQYIDPHGWVAIYYRVDVTGVPLMDIRTAIDAESESQQSNFMQTTIVACGESATVSWVACATKLGAETIEKFIAAAGLTGSEIEVYGVNDKGERLVPKGVVIVADEVGEEPPRPWNDCAAEWHTMSEEDRKEIRIKGSEFIFSGAYRGPGDGCIVYITPRSYFKEHGEMWNQSLVINKLPMDLKQVRPGIFQTKSRPWIPLVNELTSLGMKESLMLQLYLNGLDD